MSNKEQIEWATEVPFLAAMPKKNPFIVPDGYFENAVVQKKTTAVINSHCNAGSGFTLPEGYFTQLKANVLSVVNSQDLKEDNAGFGLPEGYFNKLSAEILAKTAAPARKEAKVFKLWTSDWMKYATAACLMIITATTLYIHQQNTPLFDATRTAELYNEQLLYDIDEDVIVEHLQKEMTTSNAAKSQSQVEEYL